MIAWKMAERKPMVDIICPVESMQGLVTSYPNQSDLDLGVCLGFRAMVLDPGENPKALLVPPCARRVQERGEVPIAACRE